MSKQSSYKIRQTHKVNKELKRIRKAREIESLASSIYDFGDDAEMPCTHCFQEGTRCVISSDSSRCSECI
jgi:thymidylate synthase